MAKTSLLPPIPKDGVGQFASKNGMVTYTIRLPDGLYKWISTCAKERGRDKSYIVRYILESARAQHQRQKTGQPQGKE